MIPTIPVMGKQSWVTGQRFVSTNSSSHSKVDCLVSVDWQQIWFKRMKAFYGKGCRGSKVYRELGGQAMERG